MSEQLIINASGGVLGRLASFAAKQSLLGKKVIILNCASVLVLGRRKNIINEYKESRNRGGTSQNGPHFPKDPARLVKRTIRGMLDYTRGRGDDAFKRIICYNDIPIEFEKSKYVLVTKPILTKSLTLNEIKEAI